MLQPERIVGPRRMRNRARACGGAAAIECIASRSMSDHFGRPLAHGRQEGDAALDGDTAQSEFQSKQVRSGGWAAAYGGRRQTGQVQRGGLQSPLVLYTLPVR